MYETLKRLYDTGRLPKLNLKNAVIKGWITEDQYTEICGDVYTA